MKVLVVNRLNNMGDAMCQMRALKEWKDKNPDIKLDFLTCHYLHCLMASHTDLFDRIMFTDFQKVNRIAVKPEGYDKVVEFSINWKNALDNGILRAWCEETLGFVPSTDQPYYLVNDQEKMIAANHAKALRAQGYSKLVLLQLNTPSGYERSFKEEDYNKVFDLFPPGVGLVYPGPIDLALHKDLKSRDNLILLPGYDIGTTAALINEVDYVFGAHGGIIMLAHAVGKKEVTQVMFLQAGSPNILKVPEWDNLCYPDHDRVKWIEVSKTIKKRL